MTTVRLKTKKTSQNRVTVTFVTKCDVRGQRSTNSPPRRGATRGVGESLPGLDRCGFVGDLRSFSIRGCTRQIRELPYCPAVVNRFCIRPLSPVVEDDAGDAPWP